MKPSSGPHPSPHDTNLRDPVCGMSVQPSGRFRSERGGELFVFCSVSCLEKFEREPGRYGRDAASAATQTGAPTRHAEERGYVCPMHPDMGGRRAGACPKCGMALEYAAPGSAATKTQWTCPMHPEIVRNAPGSCPICGMVSVVTNALRLRRAEV